MNVIKSVNWWHERLAEWMLANPDKFIKDAAAEFGTSPSYLYNIKNSDAFQIYWQEHSGAVKEGVKEKVVDSSGALVQKSGAVALQALDALSEKLDRQASTMTVDTLIDVSNLGLKAAGYAAKAKGQAPALQINLHAVDPKALARAREKMQQSFGVNSEEPRKLEAIDATSEKVE